MKVGILKSKCLGLAKSADRLRLHKPFTVRQMLAASYGLELRLSARLCGSGSSCRLLVPIKETEEESSSSAEEP